MVDPERLAATDDAVIVTRRSAPWPDGLLAYALYLTQTVIITHSGPTRLVDPAVHHDLIKYRLYRGGRSTAGTVPGAVVAVRVDTDDDVLAAPGWKRFRGPGPGW